MDKPLIEQRNDDGVDRVVTVISPFLFVVGLPEQVVELPTVANAAGQLAGSDTYSQAIQILRSRTVTGISELPKPGVLLTMNLTAISRE